MKIMLAVLALFGAAAIAGVAQPHSAASSGARSADTAPTPKTITVTGNGSVQTVPDRATFSFTVTTNADTAKDALAKNGAAADAVAAVLKGASNVQTSDISLNQRYDQNGNPIAGYTASTTVSADAALDKAGGLIDAAVAAGATGFSGPSFSRSDEADLYRKALENAVADAKTKAGALATSAGLTLGDVQSVVEGSQAATPLPMAAAGDSTAKIEPGTQDVDATVTVTFAAS
ncbi:MAG: SIMPL domain-containing protein [Actinomycetota bacterium]